MPDRLEQLTLAGLVHDLNNVFETLFEVHDVLKADPKNTRVCAAMRRSLKHGVRIVKSIEEQGGMTEPLRLLEQVEALLRDFLVASRGPELAVSCEVTEGLLLPGNRGAWERVLLNLLLNAARMMPHGGAIEVAMWRDGTDLKVRVRDNGPGIPPKLLPHLFEPGVSTAPRHKGLGLHIVRTIVEGLGGTVAAMNREEGSGAVFLIQVPAQAG
jgi:signal transduction histidine kinase